MGITVNELLENYNHQEALRLLKEKIASGIVAESVGSDAIRLICAYEELLLNTDWSDAGIKLFSDKEIVDASISKEKDRIVRLLKHYSSEKRGEVVLQYLVAYHAMANCDSRRMRDAMDKMYQITGISKSKIQSETIGGYEEFDALTHEVERLCEFKEKLLVLVKEFALRIVIN